MTDVDTTPAHRDTDESRVARARPLPRHRSHPLECRCSQCWAEIVANGDWRW